MNTLLFRAEYGSRAYGTHNEFSDRDVVEVVIEPKEFITGLFDFNNKMTHTAPDGERSTKDDTDTTTYGLQKFADLAVEGNPSVLATLFVHDYEVVHPLGQILVDNRNLFVSKNAGKKFLGYMTSQRMAMTGQKNKRTNRPELVHTHGYDTKFAYHMIRLGILGKELMETGEIQLPMGEENVALLMSIREGRMTKDEVLAFSYALETELEEAIEKSELPERGDRVGVSKLLHFLYLTDWMKDVG